MAKNSKMVAKPKPATAQAAAEAVAAAVATPVATAIVAPVVAATPAAGAEPVSAAAPAAVIAPAVAAKAADKKKEPEMRDALIVKSRGVSFRRAGWNFSREGIHIELEQLSDEQIELLENEPNLIVERVQFPLDEDA